MTASYLLENLTFVFQLFPVFTHLSNKVKKVICFGFNAFGQVPKDYINPINDYFNIPNNVSVRSVSFSWSSCYMTLDNGKILVSGFSAGDDGKNYTKLSPHSGDSIIKVCCSEKEILCLTKNGKCCKLVNGANWQDITNSFQILDSDTAIDVESLKFTDIVCSETQFVFLSDSGRLFNFPLQLHVNPVHKVRKIACGFEHAVCLTFNGRILSWGCGRRGQLGNGELFTLENPELVEALDGLTVTDIAAGGWHTAAVTVCGDVYSWGWNCSGQLGTGFKVDENNVELPNDSLCAIPTLVKWYMDTEPDATSVYCGSRHTMTLFKNGTLWGCGWNKYGQVRPYSDQEYYYEMCSISLPKIITRVCDVVCSSWNTAVYYQTNSVDVLQYESICLKLQY